MVQVVLLDYGSGNIHSAYRALVAAGAEVVVTAEARLAEAAAGLVVPGVGAFAACAEQLRAVGGDEVICRRAAAGRPVLGICVGHQVLFSQGVEHGVAAPGVGLFPGLVEKLPTRRLPHMGWNEVRPPVASALFAGVGRERFYFVHSYAALQPQAAPPEARLTWTSHEDVAFISAVEWGAVASTQFHPEKSGEAGARLLRNWVTGLAISPR